SLPRATGITLPERHLGLVQAREHPGLEGLVETAAHLAETHVDLAGLQAAAASLGKAPDNADMRAVDPPSQQIALAKDDAFSFVYPH
ncbi:hypothetical protein ABTK55_19805, partial [Acinetobacter baumannii]